MLESLPVVAPVLPDPGVPFQLVHHDDVATAVRAAALGRGAPGVYNLAAEETLTSGTSPRALGWRSLPVPSLAVDAATACSPTRRSCPPAPAGSTPSRVPVVMDTSRARDQLGWTPEHGARATLEETVVAARAAGEI